MHVCKANILSNPQWCFKREDDNLYTENGVTEGYQSGMGFPGGASGKKPACQCRRHKRHKFDPWV